MKKVIILSIITLLSISGAGLAGTAISLEGVGGLISLSEGVRGDYTANATADATAFTMSTAHTQGNRAYAAGSFDTAIYRSAELSSPLTNSALLGNVSAYCSATLEAFGDPL